MLTSPDPLTAVVIFGWALICGLVLVGLGVYETVPRMAGAVDVARRRRGYVLMVLGALCGPVGLWVAGGF